MPRRSDKVRSDKAHPDVPSPREEHIQELVKAFEKRLREEMPQGSETLEEIENRAQHIAREIQHKIQEQYLQTLGSGYAGKSLRCSCGKSARFVSSYARQVVTLAGVGHLRRAYYHCRACKRGFCPLDARLELGRGQCSVGVRALLCRYVSYLPFAQAARELEMTCGIGLSASTLHREAQSMGTALTQQWKENESPTLPDAAVLLRRPSQVHLSMDGVLIFVEGQWKEVKCGVAYETGTDEAGKAKGVEVANYTATLMSSARFGPRMRTLAQASGTLSCRKVAMVADGAEWIWQETGKYFPQSVQILDYWHACEHLWEGARSGYGEGSEGAKAWMDLQKQRLRADQIPLVLASVEALPSVTQTQCDLRRQLAGYLRTHAHRMQYGRLEQAGWHIGSGVVEASCKSVVQGRMKGAGYPQSG